MSNPIPTSGLWITPADMDHLTRLLNESGSRRWSWERAWAIFRDNLVTRN
jgi:hypothetical protein